MAAKVWEIAGAVRKAMATVSKDLKRLGVKVTSFGDIISDYDMIRLAEQYNRRDSILPLISNEYIHERLI